MCGRFTLVTNLTLLAERFQFDPTSIDWEPRYNLAPTQPALVLFPDHTARVMPWGVHPKWSKKLLINARVETASEKPTFKNAFNDRRCLVLADGFFEWKGKTPWRFTRKDEVPFGIAGIWEEEGCLLLTTAANRVVSPIHSRMPLIVPPDKEQGWLQGGKPPHVLDGSAMTAYEVSPTVNSWKVDSPTCIEPVQRLL